MKSLVYHNQIENQIEVLLKRQNFGERVRRYLKGDSFQDLVYALLDSKDRLFFAESGDISGWTLEEQRILGGLGMALEVSFFDDGTWVPRHAKVHTQPIQGTLLFCPGPLLSRPDCADYKLIAPQHSFDEIAYAALLEERMLPLLRFINAQEKNILLRIPGIGCGLFAGPFEHMFARFYSCVCTMIEKYSVQLSNITGVYFMEYDPLREATRLVQDIGGIRVIRWINGPSLMADPVVIDPEFQDSYMAKFVAWDHFSWPGNDFFANSRHTDDGVSAAASNTMEVLLERPHGVVYAYDETRRKFLAHREGRTLIWQNVQEDALLRPDTSAVFD